jgi:hypothetical protein
MQKTLETLMRDATILQSIDLGHTSQRGSYEDFYNGSAYKNIAASVGDNSTKFLELILYQDAFEIANPLGSAKKFTNSPLFTWQFVITCAYESRQFATGFDM